MMEIETVRIYTSMTHLAHRHATKNSRRSTSNLNKREAKTKAIQGRGGHKRRRPTRNKLPTQTSDHPKLLRISESSPYIHHDNNKWRWTSYGPPDSTGRLRRRDHGLSHQGNEMYPVSAPIRASERMKPDVERSDRWPQQLSAAHYASWEQFCEDGIRTPSSSDSSRTRDSPSSSLHDQSVCSWSPGSDLGSLDGEDHHHGHRHSSVPSCALPGLNMAINMATLTMDERDLFISMAPRVLQDPYVLMDAVVKGRSEMMEAAEQDGPQARKTTEFEGTTADILRSVEQEWDRDFQLLFKSGP
ncbi:hypothetical protein LTR06_011257 [Exophiala xenobiotica]|nr:hypothetical protein LTR06_011257 [Exophiala xenobiotica]